MKMSHLAAAAGISKLTVAALYHEDAKGITFEVLGKICAALGCQPGELLEYVVGERE